MQVQAASTVEIPSRLNEAGRCIHCRRSYCESVQCIDVHAAVVRSIMADRRRARRIMAESRAMSGLKLKAFTARLNDAIGPVEWPRVPLTWRAVKVYEEGSIIAPDHVLRAALRVAMEPVAASAVDVDVELAA